MSPIDGFQLTRKRPSKGKIVRFADHEGQKLCEVFHFDDCEGLDKSPTLAARPKARPLALVTLPWTQDAFWQKLHSTKVALENIVKTEKGIIGVAAVLNISYHKDVIVRYSFDGWKTVKETMAAFYKQDSSRQTDYFVFVLTNKETCYDKSWNLQFAICYRVDGKEYWDNNEGKNHNICY